MGGTLNKCRCTQTDTPAGYLCETCGGMVFSAQQETPDRMKLPFPNFPSLFVIATRKRGQLQWNTSGFKPYGERDKAEAAMTPYREKHGAKYEYRVVEYIPC